nr:replication initiation factor domain-containing protein [uncultured Roseateles sp.]
MRTVAAKPVMSGSKVKWTLEQIEQRNPGRVRADWLRFTVPLDAVIKSDRNLLDVTALDLMDQRGRDVVRQSRCADADPYTSAHMVSAAGARLIVELLGSITVGNVDEKGMDYYTAKTALMYEGEIVGYVLAGGSAKNASGMHQASTVHFNLFGSALIHIDANRMGGKLHDFIAESRGWITRIDLALDVWTGHQIEAVQSAYKAGQFDVRGKRPGQQEAGSWTAGHSRTFYVGSRATGKLFRAYEKGHQLFGPESGDPWIRYEVEFRSNHRIIDLSVLKRPGDVFAGAYGFCADLLEELDINAQAYRMPTQAEVADKTHEAQVVRNLAWFMNTAGATAATVFNLGGDLIAQVVETQSHRLPRRLRGIGEVGLRALYQKVADGFAPSFAPSFNGAA